MSDWQGTLQGVTFGNGTDYLFGEAGIEGLGVPEAKTADVDLVGQDGAYASPDFMGVRAILIHFLISEATTSAALTAFDTLAAAWEPSVVDVTLSLTLPGWGTVLYVGRPRGLETDMTLLGRGVIDAIGDFRAMQPRGVTSA